MIPFERDGLTELISATGTNITKSLSASVHQVNHIITHKSRVNHFISLDSYRRYATAYKAICAALASHNSFKVKMRWVVNRASVLVPPSLQVWRPCWHLETKTGIQGLSCMYFDSTSTPLQNMPTLCCIGHFGLDKASSRKWSPSASHCLHETWAPCRRISWCRLGTATDSSQLGRFETLRPK